MKCLNNEKTEELGWKSPFEIYLMELILITLYVLKGLGNRHKKITQQQQNLTCWRRCKFRKSVTCKNK